MPERQGLANRVRCEAMNAADVCSPSWQAEIGQKQSMNGAITTE